MKVKLDAVEQELARLVAKKRYESNRKKGVKNSKIGKQSDEETDLEGIAAEIAFCKLMNVFPDLSIYTRNSSQDDGDVTVNGFRVDVKTTKYHTGRLVAVPWKKPNVDYFALIVGSFPTYELKGFMRSEELLTKSRLKDLGYGKVYAASQSELEFPFEMFPFD
jgi:hypothetical protein